MDKFSILGNHPVMIGEKRNCWISVFFKSKAMCNNKFVKWTSNKRKMESLKNFVTRDSSVYFPSLHDMCIISSVIEGCKSGLYARSRGGERCSSYVILQYTRVPECPFDSNKTSWLSIQSNCLFLRETSSKERCTRYF